MAKVEIKAGASFDVLTQKELAQELDRLSMDWMAEVTRGFKYRRFLGVGPVAATAVSITENVDNVLGPGSGLMWCVTSVTVAGLAVNDQVDLFINGTDPIGSVARLATSTGAYPTVRFNVPDVVLQPNDFLTLSGSGLATTAAQLQMYGRCIELPRMLAYKLL